MLWSPNMLTRTKRAPSVDNGENVEPNPMPNHSGSTGKHICISLYTCSFALNSNASSACRERAAEQAHAGAGIQTADASQDHSAPQVEHTASPALKGC